MAPLVDAIEDITENFVFEDMALATPSHRYRFTPVGEYLIGIAWKCHFEVPYIDDIRMRHMMVWTMIEFANLAERYALELP